MSETIVVEVTCGNGPDSPEIRAVVEKMALSALGGASRVLHVRRALCLPIGAWRYNVTCAREMVDGDGSLP